MTPRLLGGKEVRSLTRKMLTLSLDKNQRLHRIEVAPVSVAYPKSATEPGHSYALDMQMNVAIVRKCTGLLTESSSLLRDSRSDGAGTLSFFRHEDVRPHSVQNGRQDL